MPEVFDPFSGIRSRLLALPGCQIEEDTRSGSFVVHVNDKESWNSDENLKKMSELFGDLIMNEYDPTRIRPLRQQMKFSFQNCDQVYVEAGPGGIGAFCSLEHAEEDPSVMIVRDVISAPEARAVYFFKMFQNIYSDPSTSALVGTSDNPVIIQTLTYIGERIDQHVSFGNQGVDDPSIQKLLKINRNYLEKEGMLVEEIEPGIYLLPSEILVPLTQEELDSRIKITSRNYDTLQYIVDLQKKYPGGETVAGALILNIDRGNEKQKQKQHIEETKSPDLT